MTTDQTRFLTAIGYPTEDVSVAGDALSIKVDGRDFRLGTSEGRFVLSTVLVTDPEEETLVRLAGYASGRILKEEAALAWEPTQASLILWQSVAVSASADVLRRFFEVFATSADWWFARAQDQETNARIPEMMIRP